MSIGAIARAIGAVLWLFLLPPPALAGSISHQYESNLQLDVCQAMTRAADFLVQAQSPAAERGVGWSWVVGKGDTAANVAGLAALALLDAHRASGRAKYLQAAGRYAEGLSSRLVGYTTENLPYKADIEFLARFSEASQIPEYLEAARKLFEVIRSRSPTGAEEVERIARGREQLPRLLGFDVALAIRAAYAVGEKRYAYQLADDVLRRAPAWYRLTRDPRFSLVSSAALVVALQTLDAGHYRPAIDRFRADMLRYQQKNGSFLINETQPSAYAVLALLDGDRADERRAAERGVWWLKSTMLRKGALADFNDYMPEPFVGQVISEVHAEALAALASACGSGLKVD